MESHFHQELGQLKMTILQMASLAERSVSKALTAFFRRDADLAQEVIEGDRAINLLEVDVDRISLRLLALDQPMAGDLRFIIGCMRIAVSLERIGDQAVNVAERALFLSTRPPLPPTPQWNNWGKPHWICFKPSSGLSSMRIPRRRGKSAAWMTRPTS